MMLTSPWPVSLYAFIQVWPRLSTLASPLASDLPGFGRSERHTDPLSPLARSRFIVGLLDSWEIGESARAVLAARHDASDLTPFPVGRIAR
jgi:hypothetical protein